MWSSRSTTAEVLVCYEMKCCADDVLHERASSNKMKNIHCEVQVILLQKSWYAMAGIDVLVMYCMKVQAKTNMKNIHCEVQVILPQKSWYVMTGRDVLVMYCMKVQAKNKHEKHTEWSSSNITAEVLVCYERKCSCCIP